MGKCSILLCYGGVISRIILCFSFLHSAIVAYIMKKRVLTPGQKSLQNAWSEEICGREKKSPESSEV
jgi:uncharacterized membrane protein required for colicin V production